MVFNRAAFCLSLLLLVFLCAGEPPPAPAAPSVDYEFVEATVSLFDNGNSIHDYAVRIRVNSGELHGFYFEGLGRIDPAFDLRTAVAVLPDGSTLPLSIKRVAPGKWDIVLAEGKAVSRGEVTYRFRFAANLAEAGHLAYTESPTLGRLAVLNYAMPQWDAPVL